jgi:hypothetical protein
VNGETWGPIAPARHDVDRPKLLRVVQTANGDSTNLWQAAFVPRVPEPEVSVAVQGRVDGGTWGQVLPRNYSVDQPKYLRVIQSVNGRPNIVWAGRFDPPRVPQVGEGPRPRPQVPYNDVPAPHGPYNGPADSPHGHYNDAAEAPHGHYNDAAEAPPTPAYSY